MLYTICLGICLPLDSCEIDVACTFAFLSPIKCSLSSVNVVYAVIVQSNDDFI